ncbi:MAG: electron transfer flavoprotein subunit beta/FixA family protein [Desulfobacteraceae bacterium]|nr:electron transfer flavoprotein subunit beta/FixA family protein [Desulfobacteraceae bacterium]
MDILVLLKQVPDTESMISIADDGVSIKGDGLKYVINPYDELAVEQALKIREAQGGTVTIVSVGSAKTEQAIRTGLAMGADKAVLIDATGMMIDGLGTAKIMAAAIKELPCDLIFAGHRAVDDDNYLVGPATAEFMGIPNISMAIKAEVQDGAIVCQCTVEGGTKDVKAMLPALVTTQRGLNEPRYTSLPGIMKAKRKPMDVKTVADLGLDAAELKPLVTIKSMSQPPERKGGRMIEGDSVQAKVAELVRVLHEEAKVI